MKQINIDTKITIYREDELSTSHKNIVEAAKSATQFAYAPYSHFCVGAALLLDNGEIVTASNQENAAYPSGLCAERVAVMYANAHYPQVAIRALAVAAYTQGAFTTTPVTPCGACRQVILESEQRYHTPIEILMYGTEQIAQVDSITLLLPLCFTGELLG